MKTIGKSMMLAAAFCAALITGPGSALAQTSAQAQPKHGGTLVIGGAQSPRTLNGAVQSGAATASVSTQLFASLIRFDDQWNPEPYLATSWKWSDDKKSITFKLRPDAVFQDGKPITSADVAFSINVVKVNHPFKTMFSAVEKVETPDPHTVVIKLSHPYPSLMIALSPALCPILPKHVYDTGNLADVKSNPHNSQNVVGSGPFELVKFVPGKEIVLKRFDKFFLKGKPYLDKIVMQINPDPTTLLIGLERGDLDMLPFVSTPTTLTRAKDDKNITVLNKGYEGMGALQWIEINTAKKPLDDKRVRQALSYAIDKNFITKVLLRGFAKPSIGPIISSSPFATPTHEYKMNLDKAKKLLDEAGLKPNSDGVRFKISIDIMPGSVTGKAIAGYARQQFKKIGVDAVLHESPDFPSWANRIAHHDFDMTTDMVWNWGDPVIGVARTYLTDNIRPIIWTNTMSYSNPKVDKLLHEAAIEPDMDKRKALYKEFQQIVTDDAPIIYLDEVPYHTLITKNVGNPPTSIWGPLSPLDNVYLK